MQVGTGATEATQVLNKNLLTDLKTQGTAMATKVDNLNTAVSAVKEVTDASYWFLLTILFVALLQLGWSIQDVLFRGRIPMFGPDLPGDKL